MWVVKLKHLILIRLLSIAFHQRNELHTPVHVYYALINSILTTKM